MAKLKLSDWASIAEIVGAVAVVFSLVYVGIQISENTVEVRETNRQLIGQRSIDATGRIAANPELAAILAKVSEDKPLDTSEQTQYSYFIRSLLYDIQEAFLLYREDRLNDEYWNTRRAVFATFMRLEPARAVYDRDKELGVLQLAFVDWVDQELAKEQ